MRSSLPTPLALGALGAIGLALLAAGCEGQSPAPECVPGARICDGANVLLCSPATRSFFVERTCPPVTACISGECLLVGAPDASGNVDGATDSGRAQDAVAADPGHRTGQDGAGDAPDSSGPTEVTPTDTGGRTPGDGARAHDGPTATDAPRPPWDALPGKDGEPPADVPVPTDLPAPTDAPPEAGADVSADGGPDVTDPPDVSTAIDGGPDVTDPPDVSTGADAGPDVIDTLPEVADTSGGADALPDVGVDVDVDADVDAEVADAPGWPDAGPEVTDAGAPPDPFAPGLLLYQRVDHFIGGDLHRVRWHPGGRYALVLGSSGKLARYDAETRAIEQVATVGQSLADLDVDASGAFFLLIGTAEDGTSHLWRATLDGAGVVAVTDELTLPYGSAAAVVAEPGGDEWAIATSTTSSINYLYRWQDGVGLVATKGYNNPGVRDVMWAAPELHAGSRAIVTADGINGAGSQTWLVEPDLVTGNGWSPGFGNPGGAAWRPGGLYGILTGWTSNVIYVYVGTGTWDKAYLPGVNNGASPNAVAWRPSGSRALIVGRATGIPLRATVMDHRAGDLSAWEPATLVNASIPDFDLAPWSGDYNVHLLSVDWRPVACDEGLIVGTDTKGWAFGLVIRFFDQDDPACEP